MYILGCLECSPPTVVAITPEPGAAKHDVGSPAVTHDGIASYFVPDRLFENLATATALARAADLLKVLHSMKATFDKVAANQIVDLGGGLEAVGLIQSEDDTEHTKPNKGLVLVDRVTGDKHRLLVSDNVLTTEVI